MSVNDPIADMLTRMRNALMAGHHVVSVPSSKIKLSIASIMVVEGFVEAFEEASDGGHRLLRMKLKYVGERRERRPVISGLKRVSSPGRRVYVNKGDIPWVRSGFQNPDSKLLEHFLTIEKKSDPIRFPDLSLAVIKLLGSGEYVAEFPGENAAGHFGLAIKDYTHSTAPTRRYPDLITQRLLKAAIDGRPMPYSKDELEDLATHCTKKEDAAVKVERQDGKSAAGLLLKSRIGEQFDALVTGASMKGTWVRLLKMPIEGMLKTGYQGVDVGDRIHVQLLSVDVEQGFIDFGKIGPSRY